MKPGRARELAVVAAFTSLLFLPFMNKAFHNDEPSNLAAAAHIARDPLHPYDFSYTWFGRTLPYAATSNNPPLFHYMLALALKIVGDGEFLLRLCFLPLDLLAALSLYLIGARFLKRPLMPTLILIAGPAYLINMGHLMGEKAAAAFGFAGLALLLDAAESNGPGRFWASALLLDAALLCKYSAVLFLVPAAIYLLSIGTKPSRVLGYLAAALAGFAVYLGWDALDRGTAASATLRTLSMTSRFPTAAPSHKLRALLAFTAGCGAATAVWPFFARRPSSRAWAALTLGAVVLFGPWLDLGPAVRPLDRLTGALFAAASGWGLFVLCVQRTRGRALCASWTASALAVSAAYWSVSSRQILFALPPLVFAWAAMLEERWPWARLRRLYAASLATTLALTLGLAAVDYRYAGAQKDFALALQRDYLDRGHRAWYTGSMGLQYYLDRAGGLGLDAGRGGWNLARPGDVVAVLKINSAALTPARPLMADTRTFDVDDAIPLRLFNGWGGEAAFYSSTWGFLPFALSREPIEEFTAVELPVKRAARFFDREAAFAALATAVALTPFLGKAFHIDDTIFLRMARQILVHPLHPFDFRYNWTLTAVPAWTVYLNPPLDSYYLAAVGAAARESEPWTHLAFLPFAAACAALMLKLARRFCRNPRAATCLCLVSPAFFVSATNVMADIPLLAFWLAAVLWTVEAAEPGRERLLWAAGAAAAAATMAKYFGLALVPLGLVYWTVKTRRSTPHLAAFLLAPLALGLWSLYSLPRAGFLHPLGSAAFGWETSRAWRLSAAAAAAFVGGGAAWPLALAPVWARSRFGARAALVAAVLAAFALGLSVPAARVECGVMALAGLLLGASALAGAASRPDPESLLLILWLSGTVAFAGLLNWTVNERALLPAFFPAAVLTIRWLESREDGRLWLKYWPWAAAPTFALSLLLALADQGHADAARDFAASRVRPLIKAGVPVRFIGHWGFQYYMEREGAEPFDYAHPNLPSGGRLCVSLDNTATLPTPEPLRSSLVREAVITEPNDLDVQLTDVQGGSAGFYGSVFGNTPYSFGQGLTRDVFLIERAP